MLSGLESPSHWLIVLAIALIVFGPKRLPELGRSLGGGIRGFKRSLAGEDEEPERTERLPLENEAATRSSGAAKPEAR